MAPSLSVELVDHGQPAPMTGIGRYTHELYEHLAPLVEVRRVRQTRPPLSSRLPFLHYFSTGIEGHRPGSLVHFVEDVACAQMMWRPVHPAVATSHDLGMLVWPAEARMHRRYDRLMLRLGYEGLRRVDAVITVSEFGRRTVIERLGLQPERVTAIHQGVDHGLFRPISVARSEVLAEHGIRDDPGVAYLLYVGSEYPRKNLETLLRVLHKLPATVRLLKVGSAGGERFRQRTLRLVERLDLGHRVHFVGRVSEEQLVALYNVADAYVGTSYLEGFGQPTLEAMACGLPVVSANSGALPEVVGTAGPLLEPADVDAFVENVAAVLSDGQLRRAMISGGLEQAARFTWSSTAQRVVEVYRLVCSRALDDIAPVRPHQRAKQGR